MTNSISPFLVSPGSIPQRYLDKIGFNGSLKNGSFKPDLSTLEQLLALHLQAFPFGNFSSYAGQPVSPDINDIADKLLDQHREGYCIEHSSLSCSVLNELGYNARNLLGRVYYQKTYTATPPLSHLVTVVILDGREYLFDPGFGGMTPTGLISFNVGNQTQQTSQEPFRFIKAEDTELKPETLTGIEVMLQIYVRDEWINIYGLNPQVAVAPSDAMMSNWYTSTSPLSLFTQQLMLARISSTDRKTLLDTTLRIHGKTVSTTQQLESFDAFKQTIEQVLRINTQDIDLFAIYKRVQERQMD